MRQYQFKQNAQGSGDELPNFVNAQEMNSVFKALNVIASQAGVPFSAVDSGTFEDLDTTVLARAILQFYIGSQVYNDNTVIGSPNTINISLINNNITLPSTLPQGFKVTWIATYTNTGACTLKVGAYDQKNLKTKDNTDINAGQITAGSYVEAVYDGTVFRAITVSGILQTGSIYFGAQQPGSLLCDGATYTSSAYPNLFAKIGTTWGSDGAGTFKVPDFRNRVPRGAGSLINEGQYQEDAIPEITGSISGQSLISIVGAGNFTSGAFEQGSVQSGTVIVEQSSSNVRTMRSVNFKASKSANVKVTTGTNAETRVKSVGVNFWIYY